MNGYSVDGYISYNNKYFVTDQKRKDSEKFLDPTSRFITNKDICWILTGAQDKYFDSDMKNPELKKLKTIELKRQHGNKLFIPGNSAFLFNRLTTDTPLKEGTLTFNNYEEGGVSVFHAKHADILRHIYNIDNPLIIPHNLYWIYSGSMTSVTLVNVDENIRFFIDIYDSGSEKLEYPVYQLQYYDEHKHLLSHPILYMFFKTPKECKRLEIHTITNAYLVFKTFEEFQGYYIVPFIEKFGNTMDYKTSWNASKVCDFDFKCYDSDNNEIKDVTDCVFINFNVMEYYSGYSKIKFIS